MNVLRVPHSRIKLWGRNGPREPSLGVCVQEITSHTTIDQGFWKDGKEYCFVFGANYNSLDGRLLYMSDQLLLTYRHVLTEMLSFAVALSHLTL